MKPGGSSQIEEPSLEFIRRFQNMLDEDDESDYKLVSSTRQRLDQLLSSEDNFINVPKPSRITTSITQRVQINVFTLAAFLASFLLYYLWKHGKSKPKTAMRTDSPTFDAKTQKGSEYKDSDLQDSDLRETTTSDESAGDDRLMILTKDQESGGENEVPALQAEDSRRSQSTSGMNEPRTSLIGLPANMAESNATRLSTNLRRMNTSNAKQIITQTDFDENNTIQLFTKMAKDIKLAEEVLTENGVERSLAQKMAVSMKTSQAVIESQQHLETQRMMIDSHHRNLDRQMSQRQHEEAIHASKYDPNWNEKLEKKRDMCWTATTRIVLEVVVLHYLSMILKPIMDSFSSQTYLSSRDLGRLAIYSICNCGSSTDTIVSSSISNSLFSTPRLLFLLDFLGLDVILGMDAGLCYGYCLLGFGCTAVLTATVHQGLRLVSAPSLLHHMVNIVALASLFGGPSMWHSHNLSMEALLSFSKIHALGIVLLSIYAVVQWNYSSCKQRVREACKSPIRFLETFDRSLQQLDRLYSHLCFLQYAMVAMLCTTFFMSAS